MDNYTVGSLAELISGNKVENKTKLIKKEVKIQTKPSKPIKTNIEELPHDVHNIVADLKQQKAVPGKIIKSKKIEKKKVPTRKKELLQNYEEPEEGNEDSHRNNANLNLSDNDNANLPKYNPLEDKERNSRTVFVGNIPLTLKSDKLKKFFSNFGIVESIRMRSVPIRDPRVPKKVAFINKDFHPNRTSLNCYVIFKSREEAVESLKANGEVLKDHHLRVQLCDDFKKPENSKAIFIGNLPFDAEEEELWKIFEPCGNISNVRIVRDSKTQVGKGFGYVNFESSDSVQLALQMDSVNLRKRELRIKFCADKHQNKKSTKESRFFRKKKDKYIAGEIKDKEKLYQGKKVNKDKKKKDQKHDKWKKQKKILSSILTKT